MYIDVGARTKKEVGRLGIQPGDYVIPRRSFAALGKENIVSGKAMDNRAGCAVLLATHDRQRAPAAGRVLVLAGGRLVADVPRVEATPGRLAALRRGQAAP